jgi:hypothetical protein
MLHPVFLQVFILVGIKVLLLYVLQMLILSGLCCKQIGQDDLKVVDFGDQAQRKAPKKRQPGCRTSDSVFSKVNCAKGITEVKEKFARKRGCKLELIKG